MSLAFAISILAVVNIGLQIASAVTAAIAALYWWRSARVTVPEEIRASVLKPQMGGTPSVMGATFIGVVQSPDLDKLVSTLKIQSQLSAFGAQFATGAATAQCLAIASQLMSNWLA